jgi:uncharacterized protein DUF6152
MAYISPMEADVATRQPGILFQSLCAGALLLTAFPAHGHHSWTAAYLEDQSVWIQGEVVEFHYQNPHAWLYVSAPDKSGAMAKYGAEWANPSRLSQQGITRTTLKPGDKVILTGSPPRDPSEYRLHVKKIERPSDGWTWAGGGIR